MAGYGNSEAELPASYRVELQAVGSWWNAFGKLKRTATSTVG